MSYSLIFAGVTIFGTVAHQEMVTSVDVDPTGLHIVSAGTYSWHYDYIAAFVDRK